MSSADILFYILGLATLLAAVGVIILPNPLVSALSLAASMVALAFLFFQLDAQFIAAVQLVVYAGAVMVLFVIVLMLFDLGKDVEIFSGGRVSQYLKVASGFLLLGILSGAIFSVTRGSESALAPALPPDQQMEAIQMLSQKIFTQYLLAFEVLGLLLLLIAIGVVAVSRIKGGTHAR